MSTPLFLVSLLLALAGTIVRRALWLVLAGVFGTIVFISHNVWRQVRPVIAARRSTKTLPQDTTAAGSL